MLKDPRGKVIPFAVLAAGAPGAIIGASTNVASYYATQKLLGQKVTTGGT